MGRAMQFKAQHTIRGVSLSDYENLYFDEEFNIGLCARVNLTRTLVRRDIHDGHLVREVIVGPEREVPGPVAKVLGSKKFEYTEHVSYQLGSYRGDWYVVPSLLPNKVDCRGYFAFTPAPDGVQRIVEGEVKVSVFGIGGIIERFVVADIEKSYDASAVYAQEWLANAKTV